MRTPREIECERNDFLAACQHILGIAEEARLSVNDIGMALRQVDVDAASAVTRGHCLSIQAIAKGVIERAGMSSDGNLSPDLAYPQLEAMNTEDLCVMLKECAPIPEDQEFCRAIVQELKTRKPQSKGEQTK